MLSDMLIISTIADLLQSIFTFSTDPPKHCQTQVLFKYCVTVFIDKHMSILNYADEENFKYFVRLCTVRTFLSWLLCGSAKTPTAPCRGSPLHTRRAIGGQVAGK